MATGMDSAFHRAYLQHNDDRHLYPGVADFGNLRRQTLLETPKRTPSRSSTYGNRNVKLSTPPRTPPASTASAAGRSDHYEGNSGRKRSRLSYVDSTTERRPAYTARSSTSTSVPLVTPKPRTPSRVPWSPDDLTAERDYATSGLVSPPPMANSQYYLAGGFDTPTAAQANAYEDAAMYSPDIDSRFRRMADIDANRYSFSAGLHGPNSDAAGPLGSRDGSQRARSEASTRSFIDSFHHDPTGSETFAFAGIGKALVGATASIAGMVFHFCTAGAFRGFQAGGGQRYVFNGGPPVPTNGQASFNQQMTDAQQMADSLWHDSDFAQDDLARSSSPAPRATKKMKSSLEDDGSITNNWVMVDDDGRTSNEYSPLRTRSTASPAGLRQRAAASPSKRRYTGGNPITFTRPASSAGLRSPADNAHKARRQSVMENTSGFGSRSSFGGFTSSESPKHSPLGKEGEKLVRQQRRREKEEERELNKMNRHIKALIREGQEALGAPYTAPTVNVPVVSVPTFP